MVMQLRCAILDDYQDVALQMADWSALAGKVGIERLNASLIERDRLVERLAGYQVIVAMRERTVFDAELLAQLPDLKLLVTAGMVNASIDMEAAARHGILVCGTRGSVGPAAELAWALLLALARNIPAETANLRANGERWQLSVGTDLKGKTLGVAGVGKLGRMVAGYGLAFGMQVVGWSRSNTPEKSRALGIGFAATLDDLLKQADVVTLHLPLTAETRGLIGARELGLMKPGALLVNTSRGPLVQEAALIAALRSGRIGGAALDVFDAEPLPTEHPFRSLPNVVATPHLGYVTRETYRIYYQGAVDDIAAWLAGSPVRMLNAPAPTA
jgi:phosphoglycerate dehydrogenase-like enzyme